MAVTATPGRGTPPGLPAVPAMTVPRMVPPCVGAGCGVGVAAAVCVGAAAAGAVGVAGACAEASVVASQSVATPAEIPILFRLPRKIHVSLRRKAPALKLFFAL
jgi:hypothetical protein